MRIAHVLPTSVPVTHDRGGAVERRVLAVAREQANAGHEATIFSAGAEDVREGGVTIRGLPCRFNRPLRDFEYLHHVRSALRGQTFDVVHSHGVPDAARILGRANRDAALVMTVDFFRYRLTSSSWGRRYYKKSLAKFDAICAVSDYCRNELLEFYGGEIAGRVETVYNGVDLGSFFPDKGEADRVADAYGLAKALPYILYLGRINAQKGSDFLPTLALGLQDARVVAAGPVGQFGEEGGGDLVNDLLDSGGEYLGPVPDADLRGLLTGATALVLPTRRDEMFGMVLIEAGACGTPAIASNLGGIPEAVGIGGLLIEVGEVAKMVEAAKILIKDAARREALSSAALENAQRFSWRRIAQDYEDVYRRVTISRLGRRRQRLV